MPLVIFSYRPIETIFLDDQIGFDDITSNLLTCEYNLTDLISFDDITSNLLTCEYNLTDLISFDDTLNNLLTCEYNLTDLIGLYSLGDLLIYEYNLIESVGFDDLNVINSIYFYDIFSRLKFKESNYPNEINYEIDSPLIVWAIVDSSDNTSLTLLEELEYEVPEDTPIIIKKDNFKKDSFQYQKKSESEKINQVHLEYKSREDDYRISILDSQDEYNIELTGEIREQSYTMHGIKRDTQARRIIVYLKDQHLYIEWSCNFITDVIGMLLCIGDVVGVTNEVIGWYGKLFRVIEIEETEEHEHILKLSEYIPSIYNDEYIEYSPPTSYYKHDDILNIPDQVLNLKCIEDRRENKIWIGFSKPITNNDWWVGAYIYHYNPNTLLWEYLGTSYWNTFTAAISSSITATQTTIPFSSTNYDSDKLQNSGIIWIDDEMIYYGEIDDVNNMFLFCERGYKDTVAVAHSSGTCVYLRNNLYYYEYDLVNDIAKTHSFKVISLTNFGVTSDEDTAPTVDITIEGFCLLPYPVGSLICFELE